MSRREIREHIFKLLFLLEFYQKDELNEQAELYLDEVEGAAPSESEAAYIRDKFHKIEDRLEEIDQILSDASAGWKLKRMAKVDLAVMRLAVYEIRYDEEIPTGVAINEAVELAKKFGGDDSPSFVNGVLAKVVPENETAAGAEDAKKPMEPAETEDAEKQTGPVKTEDAENQTGPVETEDAKKLTEPAKTKTVGKQPEPAETRTAKKPVRPAKTGAAKKLTGSVKTGTVKKQTAGAGKKRIVTAGTWPGKKRTAEGDLKKQG